MHPFAWLEDVFGTRAKCTILRLLWKHPQEPWTERAIAARLHISPNTVNRAVRDLARTEVLQTTPVGRAHLVQWGTIALVDVVQRMIALEQETGRLVMRRMADAVPDGVEVRIFGSTATGEASCDSDLDVLIQGADDDASAAAGVALFQAGRQVMPIPLAPTWWGSPKDPRRKGTAFGRAMDAGVPVEALA